MKHLTPLLALALVAACGSEPNSGISVVSESAAEDVTICSCVNEPSLTDSKAKACAALMDSKTPEEITLETMACRSTSGVPADGPDLCYCLQAINPDPSVAAACQAIIPDDLTPPEMAAKISACSRQ